jgi:protein-S-isoprenylcysteine O-methyltransferase Ste14
MGVAGFAPMNQFVLIIAVSILLAWISRRSFRAPRSHGFYRFFAWEAIALQVVLNVPFWFDNPFSPLQIVSWCLLVVSMVLVIAGFVRLRGTGGAVPVRGGDPLFRIENTTRLVTVGIYSRVRHPLYSSLLFLAWGACLKHLSAEGLLSTVFASIFLLITARIEEEENVRKFGAAYEAYMTTSGMFLPCPRRAGAREST